MESRIGLREGTTEVGAKAALVSYEVKASIPLMPVAFNATESQIRWPVWVGGKTFLVNDVVSWGGDGTTRSGASSGGISGSTDSASGRDATVRSGFGFGPEPDRTGPWFGPGPGPVRPFALGSGSGFGMGWVFCEPGPNWSKPRTRKLCLRASL